MVMYGGGGHGPHTNILHASSLNRRHQTSEVDTASVFGGFSRFGGSPIDDLLVFGHMYHGHVYRVGGNGMGVDIFLGAQ